MKKLWSYKKQLREDYIADSSIKLSNELREKLPKEAKSENSTEEKKENNETESTPEPEENK